VRLGHFGALLKEEKRPFEPKKTISFQAVEDGGMVPDAINQGPVRVFGLMFQKMQVLPQYCPDP
jgi:hypothetical protein